MFLKKTTNKFTENFSDNIKKLSNELETAEAVLIGAGSGLSTAAGLTYSGERFYRYFSDFHEKYGITDIYSGGFYPYKTLEEYLAWWSRHIYYNRYAMETNGLYEDLFKLVKEKNYFVLTTNVDHQFQLAGFDKKRLFYTQGDYGLWQCSKPCHDKTYDNEETVGKMVAEQENMRIPSDLIPYCPVCGAPMTMNLRSDHTFVQDEGWYEAQKNYDDFIKKYKNKHILFLELGVGANTPVIIKYPFCQMTAKNPKAVYACINDGEAICPDQIAGQSICLNEDIGKVVHMLMEN